MDIFLALVCVFLILLGMVGSVLPALPGPPLAWLGLLVLYFTAYGYFSIGFLGIMAAIMVAITILDFVIPAWGTKKFGGTKAGAVGSVVGLMVGLFFGFPGIVLGPFLGALAGELLANPTGLKQALRSATGSFLGFVVGTTLKLAYCGVCAFYFIKAVFF